MSRRRLTVGIVVALLPGVLFASRVMGVARWGVPLWPHQLWFWLLGASIVGPLVAAVIVRRWLWSSACVLVSLVALVSGLGLQFGVTRDMLGSCPGTHHPGGWETRIDVSVVRAEATCVYIDPDAGREVDRNGFTMFARIRGIL